MRTIAHGGCTDTARESALKVDSGQKSLPTPRTRTRVSIAPGFSAGRGSNSRAINMGTPESVRDLCILYHPKDQTLRSPPLRLKRRVRREDNGQRRRFIPLRSSRGFEPSSTLLY